MYAAGLPPQYLLAACRFCQEVNVPTDRIRQLFRQWMTYVVRNDKSIDVNKMTFDQFYQTIQKFKSDYGIPNKIYDDVSFIQGINENKQHKTNKTMKQIKTLTESVLRKMITESVRRVLRESIIPSYEHPVYIDCTSHKDADVSIEIGYSSYSSSLFYVGECVTDCYAALEAVVRYLVENDIIDHYA